MTSKLTPHDTPYRSQIQSQRHGSPHDLNWDTFILILSTVAFILSLSTSPDALAKDSVSGLDGIGAPAELKHIIQHNVSDEYYVEKYTFNAKLKASTDAQDEQGAPPVDFTGRLYFSISISNIGSGDHKATARGVIELGDQRYKWKVSKKSSQWSRDRNRLDLRIGGARLYGDLNKLHFEVKRGGGKMKVSFTPIAKPWRPGRGGVIMGDGKSAEFTLMPMAELEGSFTPKNKAELKVSGVGWGRHTWSQLGPHEWSKWNYQVRVFDAHKRRALFIRQVQTGGDYKKRKLSYALLVSGADRLFEGYGLQSEARAHYRDPKHDNHYRFPTDVTFTGQSVQGDAQLKMSLKTTKRHYRRNPVAKYSWMKRKVIEMATKPMIYAYQTDYHVKLSGARTLDFSGDQGRYETYFFNK